MSDLVLSRNGGITGQQDDRSLAIHRAIEHRNLLVEFVQKVMIKGTDYGNVPGVEKPSLLKPGAEKLCTLFQFVPRFEIIERIEDWTGKDHGGELFFFYNYRCNLYQFGEIIATSEGSCNSWEKKYRYRTKDRSCPSCGAAAIKRSKFPPKGKPNEEPGWYCHAAAGGCGAQFAANDPAIIGQETGRVPNPDIADVVNTIMKMAQKRALVAAVSLGANASEFFTQDVEDMSIIEAKFVPHVTTVPAPIPVTTKPQCISKDQAEEILKVGAGLDESVIRDIVYKYGFKTRKSITTDKFDQILLEIRERADLMKDVNLVAQQDGPIYEVVEE